MKNVITLFSCLVISALCLSAFAASPTPESTPKLASDAISRLINQPNSPLPTGTQLLNLTIHNGVAMVNFSKEFRTNFRGGDSQEISVVNSVLQTMGAYPNINQTQILVEGKSIDSLGGMVVISSALNVIRPVVTPVSHRFYAHRKMKH
jgi:spore germination protein GerM